MFIGSLLVTDGANPGWFLFIHLNIQSGIKTLQVWTRQGPTWYS